MIFQCQRWMSRKMNYLGLLDELFRTHYFYKLDLRSNYYQILVGPEDRVKTTFRTHHGHYEWLVIPFGFTNALVTSKAL